MKIIAFTFIAAALLHGSLCSGSLVQPGDFYRGGYICAQGFTNVEVLIDVAVNATQWYGRFFFLVPTSGCYGIYGATITLVTPAPNASTPPIFSMEPGEFEVNPCYFGVIPTFLFQLLSSSVMYTPSMAPERRCGMMLAGKSVLRRPCIGISMGSDGVALSCATETQSHSNVVTDTQTRTAARLSMASSSPSLSRTNSTASSFTASISPSIGSPTLTHTYNCTHTHTTEVSLSLSLTQPQRTTLLLLRPGEEVAAVSAVTVLGGLGIGSSSASLVMPFVQNALWMRRLAENCKGSTAALQVDDGTPLFSEPADNPLDMRIPLSETSEDINYALGTIVGNGAIVVGLALALQAVEWCVKRISSSASSRLAHFLAKTTRETLPLLPGSLVTPFNILAQPTASAAIFLIVAKDRDSMCVLIGSLSLVCTLAIPVLVVWMAYFSTAVRETRGLRCRSSPNSQRSAVGRLMKWLFECREVWSRRHQHYASVAERRHAEQQSCRRYGCVMGGTFLHRRWFTLMQQLTSVGAGALVGIAASGTLFSSCVSVQIVGSCLIAIPVAVVVAIVCADPCVVRFDNGVICISALCCGVSEAILVATAGRSEEEGLMDASGTLNDLTLYLQLVTSLCFVSYSCFAGCTRKRSVENGEDQVEDFGESRIFCDVLPPESVVQRTASAQALNRRSRNGSVMSRCSRAMVASSAGLEQIVQIICQQRREAPATI